MGQVVTDERKNVEKGIGIGTVWGNVLNPNLRIKDNAHDKDVGMKAKQILEISTVASGRNAVQCNI